MNSIESVNITVCLRGPELEGSQQCLSISPMVKATILMVEMWPKKMRMWYGNRSFVRLIQGINEVANG